MNSSYNYIVNPLTNRKVIINGNLGRKIIQKYYSILSGGNINSINNKSGGSSNVNRSAENFLLAQTNKTCWFDSAMYFLTHPIHDGLFFDFIDGLFSRTLSAEDQNLHKLIEYMKHRTDLGADTSSLNEVTRKKAIKKVYEYFESKYDTSSLLRIQIPKSGYEVTGKRTKVWVDREFKGWWVFPLIKEALQTTIWCNMTEEENFWGWPILYIHKNENRKGIIDILTETRQIVTPTNDFICVSVFYYDKGSNVIPSENIEIEGKNFELITIFPYVTGEHVTCIVKVRDTWVSFDNDAEPTITVHDTLEQAGPENSDEHNKVYLDYMKINYFAIYKLSSELIGNTINSEESSSSSVGSVEVEGESKEQQNSSQSTQQQPSETHDYDDQFIYFDGNLDF